MPDYINAGLAKRLAEAADSFRDGLYYHFVCKLAYPFNLMYTQGSEDTELAATRGDDLLEFAGGEAAGYYKFGPYSTAIDNEPDIQYDSIQLRFMMGDTEIYSEILTNDVDAIILSLSAYDKFMQPYYVRLYGLDIADDFRASAIGALNNSSHLLPVKHAGKSYSSSSPGLSGGTHYTAGDFDR
jgi:hypothetical protein